MVASEHALLLNRNDPMPLVGFGLWKVPKDKCADLVVESLKAGYRLLVYTKFLLFVFRYLYFHIYYIIISRITPQTTVMKKRLAMG